jgi:hypothetical protein
MKKWEYAQLDNTKGKWYLDDCEVGNPLPTPGMLRRMGREGWELVSVVMTDESETSYQALGFFFKREIIK